ncbi:hypothetical protein DNTS_005103, partial [Danionella cerebrum]
ACRDFKDDGTCKDACPRLLLYDSTIHQMVPNPNGELLLWRHLCGKMLNQSVFLMDYWNGYNFVVTDHDACVRTCGANMHEVEVNGVRKCKQCDGVCPKVCDGLGTRTLFNTIAVNASNIDSFINCTKINGHITIIATTFKGDSFTNTSRFLLIQDWPEHLTSLSPFENLEIIRGRTKQHGIVSLAALNMPHLEYLGLHSLKEISDGDVVIRNNRRLCYTDGSYWNKLFRSQQQQKRTGNNAPVDICEQRNSTCDSLCGDEGCWGPGPSMCFSCQYVKRGSHCASHCHLLQGEPPEYMSNNECLTCDPECKVLNGKPSCHGPENYTNGIMLRYMTDPTQKEPILPEYMNQEGTVNPMINPNYEQPNREKGNGYVETYTGRTEGPEYLNTSGASLSHSQCASLDNPDYQDNFLPTSSSPSCTGGDFPFLSAAQNLQHLGLSTAMLSHVR